MRPAGRILSFLRNRLLKRFRLSPASALPFPPNAAHGSFI